MDNYIPTIGLEIHVELNTKTKMFCSSLNASNETNPNVNVCPVCMGHPGTLPVINKEAVKKVLIAGKALGGKLAKYSRFDRKNYFYPDLPKGYQISQYKYPLVEGGYLEIRNPKHEIRNNIEIQNSKFKINITRIHLEEDAGGSKHTEDGSLIDYNRAGVPLMELVTEPDIKSGEEARKFAEELRLIFRYLDISNADMEKGQMRIEANISVRPVSVTKLGTKVEVKNLNSFRAVERAINYEIERQSNLLEDSEKIIQETRGWDENKQITFSQREKEESHDYRYFPEPDLPPLLIFSAEKIVQRRASDEVPPQAERRRIEFNSDKIVIPELPQQKRDRFKKEYSLKDEAVEILVQDDKFAGYFEEVVSELGDKNAIQLAVNYLTSDMQGFIKEGIFDSWDDLKISPENFAELIKMVQDKQITSRVAKDVLKIMLERNECPSKIVEEKGLKQTNDEPEMNDLVEKIINENSSVAEEYKKGKEASLKFLIGQGMKETRGSVDPEVLSELLRKRLS